MESFHSKVMFGMSVVGSALQGSLTHITAILAGQHDLAIKCFFHHRIYGQAPDSELALDTQLVIDHFERLKTDFRNAIEQALDREAHANKAQLLGRLAETNKPHPMGTVDAIAKRFNVSKSEVRRRKADGTLGELLITQT